MRKSALLALTLLILALIPNTFAQTSSPLLGDTLPNFKLQDTKGITHELQDYRGSVVVLLTVGYG